MADEDEPETVERDPDTSDMFGAAPLPKPVLAEPSAAYTVIARKYRPRTFEDLFGQEAMVRTLRNAIASWPTRVVKSTGRYLRARTR